MLTFLTLGLTACGPSGSREAQPPSVAVADGGRTGDASVDAAGGSAGLGGASGDALNPDPDPGSGGRGGGTGGGGGGAGGAGGGMVTGGTSGGAGGAGGSPDDGGPSAPDTSPVPEVAPPSPDMAAPEVAPPDATIDVPSVPSLSMGLVSRWPLDEGMGTMVNDSQGINHGTVQGGATWMQPGFRNPPSRAAMHFDGNDDYVELGIRQLPANNAPQTISFWFRFAAVPGGTDARVAVSLTNGSTSGARLKMGLRGNQAAAWKSDGDVLVAAPAPSTNAWHHFVYARDAMGNRLYIDGVERARSTTMPDVAPVTNARIGAIYNNAENFAGEVDDVRIYNRGITAAEAMALFQAQ